jgi:hypothetical protein
MRIIRHRINSIAELNKTPFDLGVEIDIRTNGNDLILQHEPFMDGENFDQWLKSFKHQTLILNIKEEGLENRALDMMRQYGIEDFFFLDQSFPFLIITARNGEKRCAVRVSEFESMDTALSLMGKIDWIWVDYFTRFPLNRNSAKKLHAAGFKLCVVSPELQGFDPQNQVPLLKQLLVDEYINADAVCTKHPDLWI